MHAALLSIGAKDSSNACNLRNINLSKFRTILSLQNGITLVSRNDSMNTRIDQPVSGIFKYSSVHFSHVLVQLIRLKGKKKEVDTSHSYQLLQICFALRTYNGYMLSNSYLAMNECLMKLT